MPEAPFLQDLALVFVAALIGGGLAILARQPLFVGYIIGGLLISPFTPGPAIQDVQSFELFAEIGVILLMFSIGIEFSLHEVTRIGSPVIVGAPLAAALMIGLTTAVGMLLGWPLRQAVAAGMVLSVASTLVVVKLLAERGELHTPHARLAIATVLAEDLIVVALIGLLPALAGGEAGQIGRIAAALMRAALVLIPFFYLANRVVPRVMTQVARRNSAELFILVAMAIGVGTAALSSNLGLSIALGAFLGGLIISESEFTHEILARVLPMRDLFGALFFVSVGTLIRPADLLANLGLLTLVLILILVGKVVVRVAVLRIFGYPLAAATLVSVHLAQTGEFSFVLAQVARSAGLIGEALYQAILAASLISILVTALVSDLAHLWIEEPQPRRLPHTAPADAEPGRVLICGFGRVGGSLGEALDAFGVAYTVVDLDFTVIEALRQRGVHCVYGDAASEPVLRRAGGASARLAVVATPDFERTRLAVRRLRALNPTMPILARSEQLRQRASLLEVGAIEVIQPEFEAAQTLVRHGLERLGIAHARIKEYMEQQRSVQIGDSAVPAAEHTAPLVTRVMRVGPGFCDDVSLRQARVRERTGVWVLSVRRPDGSEVTMPSAETMLRAGDEVTVIGLPGQIALFESLNQHSTSAARPRSSPE